MRITDEHIAHLRAHGYALVHGFLGADELAAARDDLARRFPTADQYAADPSKYEPHYQQNLPYDDAPFLNRLPVHPELLSYLERVIGTDDVMVTQSLLWAKYPGPDGPTHDQPFHCDYRNNMLVHPRLDGDYRVANIIVYYDDVTEAMGPTCVLPFGLTDVPLDAFLTRDDHPELYDQEVKATVPAGSLLLYTMATFHRGSVYTQRTGARFTQHLVYRSARHQWVNWSPWALTSAIPAFVRLMEECTPRQRAVFGFPTPADEYWTHETIEGVQRRYPSMDMTPYRDALAARPDDVCAASA